MVVSNRTILRITRMKMNTFLLGIVLGLVSGVLLTVFISQEDSLRRVWRSVEELQSSPAGALPSNVLTDAPRRLDGRYSASGVRENRISTSAISQWAPSVERKDWVQQEQRTSARNDDVVGQVHQSLIPLEQNHVHPRSSGRDVSVSLAESAERQDQPQHSSSEQEAYARNAQNQPPHLSIERNDSTQGSAARCDKYGPCHQDKQRSAKVNHGRPVLNGDSPLCNVTGQCPWDVVIVGAGMTGVVLADLYARVAKRRVLVLDRRDHLGGDCFSQVDHVTGIRVQKYVPLLVVLFSFRSVPFALILILSLSSYVHCRGDRGNRMLS